MRSWTDLAAGRLEAVEPEDSKDIPLTVPSLPDNAQITQ